MSATSTSFNPASSRSSGGARKKTSFRTSPKTEESLDCFMASESLQLSRPSTAKSSTIGLKSNSAYKRNWTSILSLIIFISQHVCLATWSPSITMVLKIWKKNTYLIIFLLLNSFLFFVSSVTNFYVLSVKKLSEGIQFHISCQHFTPEFILMH